MHNSVRETMPPRGLLSCSKFSDDELRSDMNSPFDMTNPTKPNVPQSAKVCTLLTGGMGELNESDHRISSSVFYRGECFRHGVCNTLPMSE